MSGFKNKLWQQFHQKVLRCQQTIEFSFVVVGCCCMCVCVFFCCVFLWGGRLLIICVGSQALIIKTEIMKLQHANYASVKEIIQHIGCWSVQFLGALCVEPCYHSHKNHENVHQTHRAILTTAEFLPQNVNSKQPGFYTWGVEQHHETKAAVFCMVVTCPCMVQVPFPRWSEIVLGQICSDAWIWSCDV